MSEQPDSDEEYDDEDIKDFLTNAEVSVAPGVKLDDICGIQHAVEKMKEKIILPAKFPQLFAGCRKTQSSGILLYGAPGTGKTLLVQATIAELVSCNTLCYKLSAYDLLSRWQKNPIKALQAMFKKAERYKHSVFFIDDVEVLSNQRDGETDISERLRTEFLKLVHHMRTNCRECIFCVVGVTNKPWNLADDYSFRRMLEFRVNAPLPDCNDRCALFKQQLTSVQHSLSEEQFRMLAQSSEGFTGSDIVMAARDVMMQPIRKIQAATHFKHISGPSVEDPNKIVDDLLIPCSTDNPGAIEINWLQIEGNKISTPVLTLDDAMKALSGMKPCVSKKELDMYQNFTDVWGPI